ncbi:MAG: hypothetical protein C4329_10035 [Chitinophagaceae bacterium]
MNQAKTNEILQGKSSQLPECLATNWFAGKGYYLMIQLLYFLLLRFHLVMQQHQFFLQAFDLFLIIHCPKITKQML